MALRKLLPLLLALGLVGGFLVAAGWLALRDTGTTDEPSPNAVEAVNGEDVLDDVNLAEAAEVLLDENGAPLAMSDGTPFPPGTKRDGRRRLVTPDGRVFVRDRGGGGRRPTTNALPGGGPCRRLARPSSRRARRRAGPRSVRPRGMESWRPATAART